MLAAVASTPLIHTVDGKHERGEVTSPSLTGLGIFFLLLSLTFLQDLVRVLTTVCWGVRARDPDVEDRRETTFPKAVDTDVTSKVRVDDYTGTSTPSSL